MNIPEEIVEALVEHYGADAVRSALDKMQAQYKQETPVQSDGVAQKRVVCPVCGGEGSTPGRYKQLRMRCPSCNGTGELLRDIADIEREEAWEAMQQENKAEEEPWTRKKVLAEAERCVCGHREQDYGSPEDSFKKIALLWTAYTGVPFLPVDVAVMMGLLKMARIASDPHHMDSWVDLAGYAACGGEIAAGGN